MHDQPHQQPIFPGALVTRQRKHKIFVFIITAALYACVHACRTAWAYSKPSLATDLGLDNASSSWLDSSFLCAYALGLYLSGWLGDRIKLTSLLGIGMIFTVISLGSFVIIFGFMKIQTLLTGMLAFIVSGLGQSTVSLVYVILEVNRVFRDVLLFSRIGFLQEKRD